MVGFRKDIIRISCKVSGPIDQPNIVKNIFSQKSNLKSTIYVKETSTQVQIEEYFCVLDLINFVHAQFWNVESRLQNFSKNSDLVSCLCDPFCSLENLCYMLNCTSSDIQIIFILEIYDLNI